MHTNMSYTLSYFILLNLLSSLHNFSENLPKIAPNATIQTICLTIKLLYFPKISCARCTILAGMPASSATAIAYDFLATPSISL